ncbi:MAG: hypothetical protein KDB61_07025 [Planctomycetes bacterium]|nr:hypothetical protein [Planctomycetota bacterium]
MKAWITAGLLLCLTTAGWAAGDDFRREGNKIVNREALEGHPPPALQVTGWMNTNGKPLTFEELKGKVVVIDFWGTW